MDDTTLSPVTFIFQDNNRRHLATQTLTKPGSHGYTQSPIPDRGAIGYSHSDTQLIQTYRVKMGVCFSVYFQGTNLPLEKHC